ncbi:oligosaccharide flippase family protein [Psychrobacter celer]|uniref:oligosaccharide flippase family protein n=1 Tax=Psychrobacter celer TaxID=306572 RepID=UPI003FD60EAD
MRDKIVSLILLVVGTLLGSIANMLVQIYLARELLVIDFGFYTSILNLANLLTPLIGFGISSFMLKAYAEEGYGANRWLSNINILLIASAAIVFCVLQLIGFLQNQSLNYFIIYSFFYIYMLSVSYNSFMSIRFQIEGRFRFFSLWQVVPNLLKLVSIFICISFLGKSVHSISIAYLITGMIVIVFSLNSLHRMRSGNITLLDKAVYKKYRVVTNKELVINAIPFGLNGIFYLIYFQSSILILSLIKGYEEVAYFGLAVTLLTAACLLPSILFQKFLMPKIHFWSIYERKKLYSLYRIGNYYIIILGILAAFANILFTKFFLVYIFGVKYEPATTALYIMSLVILIKYFNFNAGALMTTKNLINLKSKIMMFAAILNIVLGLVLIYFYGVGGAIVGMLVTECFIGLCSIKAVNREFKDVYE